MEYREVFPNRNQEKASSWSTKRGAEKEAEESAQVHQIWLYKSWEAKFIIENCTTKPDMEESPKDCKEQPEAITVYTLASLKIRESLTNDYNLKYFLVGNLSFLI